ncbi:MAG: hypothetical protein MZV63_64365 [Marinilabiliales bacterium]|nr:hypothetical protein [Marinilabiliales bacterium]
MAEEELTEMQEQELFEHYRYVVDPGQSMLRIDKYLTARIEGVSRTRVQCCSPGREHNGERCAGQAKLPGQAA